MVNDEVVELETLIDKLRRARERLTEQLSMSPLARTRATRTVRLCMADLEQFIGRVEALRLQSELQRCIARQRRIYHGRILTPAIRLFGPSAIRVAAFLTSRFNNQMLLPTVAGLEQSLVGLEVTILNAFAFAAPDEW
jgi:hypothetical protein